MLHVCGAQLRMALAVILVVSGGAGVAVAADDAYVPGKELAERLSSYQGGEGKVLRMGTAVDDEQTVEIRTAPLHGAKQPFGAAIRGGKGALPTSYQSVPPLEVNRSGKFLKRPAPAAPGASATPAAEPLPVPTDYDQFFAAPLGDPGNPDKYKYIGPIVGGHDPGRVDWSGFGAKSAGEKRRMMVDYAQGRLKVGAEFGGIDAASDSPAAPPSSTGGGDAGHGEAGMGPPETLAGAPAPGRGPPTIDENGEQAWCNTIQNPNVAPRSKYRNDLMAGIDRVIAAGSGLEGPGSDKIVDYDAFHAAVVEEMKGRGYCALHDGEELALCRPGDAFNEQFDISTASGFVRRFYAAYIKPPVPGLRAQGAGR